MAEIENKPISAGNLDALLADTEFLKKLRGAMGLGNTLGALEKDYGGSGGNTGEAVSLTKSGDHNYESVYIYNYDTTFNSVFTVKNSFLPLSVQISPGCYLVDCWGSNLSFEGNITGNAAYDVYMYVQNSLKVSCSDSVSVVDSELVFSGFSDHTVYFNDEALITKVVTKNYQFMTDGTTPHFQKKIVVPMDTTITFELYCGIQIANTSARYVTLNSGDWSGSINISITPYCYFI